MPDQRDRHVRRSDRRSAAAASSSAPAPSAPAPRSPPAPATAPTPPRRRRRTPPRPAARTPTPGKPVTIGFSAPAADHGWIAAITTNAKAQAAQVLATSTFEPVERPTTSTSRSPPVETLINKKVDALVILPFDGKAAHRSRPQGDGGRHPGDQPGPESSTRPLAYRTLDRRRQLRHGRRAPATTSASSSRPRASANPVIAEIAGHRQPAADPGPQPRASRTRWRRTGFKVEQPAGRRVHRRVRAAGRRQPAAGAPKIDAIWNHDDDQGVGVLAAIKQAGRNEFFMVGGAGSRERDATHIKADNTVLKATVTYPPTHGRRRRSRWPG